MKQAAMGSGKSLVSANAQMIQFIAEVKAKIRFMYYMQRVEKSKNKKRSLRKNFNMRLLLILPLLWLMSCEEQETEAVLDKSGSVEIQLSSHRIEGWKDVITRKQIIWVNNSILKETIQRDTVPSLGTTKEWGENEQGEEKEIQVPKEYQFFITIK